MDVVTFFKSRQREYIYYLYTYDIFFCSLVFFDRLFKFYVLDASDVYEFNYK